MTEGVSESAAQNIAGLKKDAMASHAEDRLADTRWLPAFLRLPVGMTSEPQTA